MTRQYAIRQISLDTGDIVVHGHTTDDRIADVWRKRKTDHQEIVWREIGEWQADDR